MTGDELVPSAAPSPDVLAFVARLQALGIGAGVDPAERAANVMKGRAERAAQGLSEHLEDEAVLRRIAALVDGVQSRTRRRAAS